MLDDSKVFDEDNEKKLQKIATAIMSRADTGLGMQSRLSEDESNQNCINIQLTEQSIKSNYNQIKLTDQSSFYQKKDNFGSEHTIIDYRAETQRDEELQIQKMASDQLLIAPDFLNNSLNEPAEELQAPSLNIGMFDFDMSLRPRKDSVGSTPIDQQKPNNQFGTPLQDVHQ